MNGILIHGAGAYKITLKSHMIDITTYFHYVLRSCHWHLVPEKTYTICRRLVISRQNLFTPLHYVDGIKYISKSAGKNTISKGSFS